MMNVVICTTRLTPTTGIPDPDLLPGALYEVVESDVASEAGEFMIVRRYGTLGPDRTRHKSMFKPVSVSGSKMTIQVDRGDMLDMIRFFSDMLDYVTVAPCAPAHVSAEMDIKMTHRIYKQMQVLSDAIRGAL
jgi:hypothetical protein